MAARALFLLLFFATVSISPAQEPAKTDAPKSVVRSLRDTGQLGIGIEPKMVYKSDLLPLPAIRDELKLSDQQRKNLDKAEGVHQADVKLRAKQLVATRDALKQNGDAAALRQFNKEAIAYGTTLTKDDEKPMLKILSKEQLSRLEQIQIRAMGYLAFSLPDVVEKLALTEEQAADVARLVSEGRKKVFSATAIAVTSSEDFASTKSDEQKQKVFSDKEVQKKTLQVKKNVVAQRSAVLQEIRKILSNPQRGQFTRMAGKPFDFTLLSPGKSEDLNKELDDFDESRSSKK